MQLSSRRRCTTPRLVRQRGPAVIGVGSISVALNASLVNVGSFFRGETSLLSTLEHFPAPPTQHNRSHHAQLEQGPRTGLCASSIAVSFRQQKLSSLLPEMDQGHYNCRDYYVSPHIAPTTIVSDSHRNPIWRHESWVEMEQRCRSPASLKPKFPLLRLPIELRQEIFSYLLPRTKDFLYSNPLASHARNFGAVQKRSQKGMVLPTAAPSIGRRAATNASSNVVWQRGNTKLLCVCKQIHDECAEMIYGGNTFLLFVTYNEIVFRLQWLLPSGMAPSARKPFLDLLSQRYLQLIRRVTIHVDHVDPYTGMIKFNVSGKGLAHGLRRQVQRLVNALKDDSSSQDGEEAEALEAPRRLSKVHIRVSNSNEVLDSIKSDAVRQREGGGRVNDDVEDMLAPFRQLYGVRDVSVRGAVDEDFARGLEQRMASTERPSDVGKDVDVEDGGLNTPAPGVCVYGNDMS